MHTTSAVFVIYIELLPADLRLALLLLVVRRILLDIPFHPGLWA